ncbi:MAG: hypothetical protein RBT87_04025 [bacterium]|jgi:hypothetical protein|nr:hypothetical protein [bacterium]
MNRFGFLTILVLAGLFSCGCKKAEVVIAEQDFWVCRHYSGGPQCMDEKELKKNSVDLIKPHKENELANVVPIDVTLENAADKLRESGVTVLETNKINNPVCSACYQCPKYSIDLCFSINDADLAKALKLGFRKKEMKKPLLE